MTRAEDRPVTQFAAPYAADDGALLGAYLGETALGAGQEAAIDRRAAQLIGAIRSVRNPIGGLEDFLRQYGLSTPEGLALMVLAEALLRVPDAVTQDRLIEDRLGAGDWTEHVGRGEKWFVSASTWALGLSSRIVHPEDTPDNILAGLVKRLGAPAVRTAVRQAMRFLGHHFVIAETIEDALARARPLTARGFRFSFDMLGEGARTDRDARRYAEAYGAAITAIGEKAGGTTGLPARPGISVKLSALHPRYEPLQRERVLRELGPRLRELARLAKGHDLNFTIDAEEADRLELSLALFAELLRDSTLSGWTGLGLAVQAYQKRAAAVIDWLVELAAARNATFMVRLVKGAYWDTEIKRAQERGLADYPVFTRKPATDVSYLACARRLLDARPRLYPQFATHNALTVATILERAGDLSGFEFQRLHGMGENLYEALRAENEAIQCRVYAPVGGYRDLLAYLVRRLLENAANSSFVSAVGDAKVPTEDLLARPAALLARGGPRHPRIPLPRDLFAPTRLNSPGIDFGDCAAVEALRRRVMRPGLVEAAPLLAGVRADGKRRAVRNPATGETIGGMVETPPAIAAAIFAKAGEGFRRWSATLTEDRATILERAAGTIEAERDSLADLLIREGGKTIADCIAEWREAIDFCRYYAAEARRLFAAQETLPGPTGEENVLRYRARGVFAAISPWNFPLSIFVGQVAAALAAGNAVIAKPAEQTPLIAVSAARIFHLAGVPEDALLLAPGAGDVGAALVADLSCAGVVFTGSTETARRINRALAARDGPIVPLIAETGGINAMIVDATALPEQVADDVVTSAFRSAGQRCSALRLLCLQDDVADAMLTMIEGAAAELKLGDPADFATDIGPIIDDDARTALQRHIVAMRAAPYATVRFVGPLAKDLSSDGTFMPPHIVELDEASRLTGEVFGPILHVVRWKAEELDTIVDNIAASGYGLTLGVHSRIAETASRVAARLPVGNIYVNRSMIGAVVGVQPFGGSGLSGTGPKAGGPDYLRRFVQEQVVSTNTAALGGNASLVAMDDE
jgi:RHH-type proline utilization regulon transcriptional repressor/proline dehydrogenase/delta 1-pyrroline-5-carboxylate dehydrogenase